MHNSNSQTTSRQSIHRSAILLVAFVLFLALVSDLAGGDSGALAAEAPLLANATSGAAPFQQAQQPQAASLQTQLNQIQQQAQRQLSQLNGMVMNVMSNSSDRYSNVLEAISSVGKVIHQQISAAANPNHVNIITGPASSGGNQQQQFGESANNKKNEYQAIQMADTGGPFSHGLPPPATMVANSSASSPILVDNAYYREQGELLRQEITRRASQLQQVVANSMDLLKNNSDMIMRRLLEQMNVRLDQAKAKADKIISNEPLAMNEMTVKALATINTGLNNLNTIIANIVTRMDLANKQDQNRINQAGSGAGASAGGVRMQQRLQHAAAAGEPSLPQLLDTGRFKANLHQLSQQFQQALNGSSLHQQLALIRSQRLQQQQALAPMGANQGAQQAQHQH